MVQVINSGEGNTLGAIPLYQKGFNWLKYWLGFCFALVLWLLFAAATTFLVLYILAQSGAIKKGRMMPGEISLDHPISTVAPAYIHPPSSQLNEISTSLFNKVLQNAKYEKQYFIEKLLKKAFSSTI